MLTKILDQHQGNPRELVIPPDYHIDYTGGVYWLIPDDYSANFMLTDRTFGDVSETLLGEDTKDIDYWTGGAISHAIENTIARKDKARILDVGAGSLNMAAYQIAKMYGDSVEVHALDICYDKGRRKAENLSRYAASSLKLPFADEAFDIIITYQLISSLPADEKLPTVDEIVRVLAVDGSAVVDMVDPIVLRQNSWIQDYVEEREGLFVAGLGTMPYADGMRIGLRLLTDVPNAPPGQIALGMSTPQHFLIEKRQDF